MSTVNQATAEIIALINSSPRSPRAEEIEAVIANIGSPNMAAMSPAHAGHYREWRVVIDEHMREPEINAEGAAMSAHMDKIDAMKARIFSVPARTWGDVMLYAQACSWEYWCGADPEGPDMRDWLAHGPQCDHDDAVDLAKLLEAIFTVAGVGHFGKTEVRS